MNYYRHVTKLGTWEISYRNYQWEITWNGRDIGRAETASEALNKLMNGETIWPSKDFTIEDCAFPAEIEGWDIELHR